MDSLGSTTKIIRFFLIVLVGVVSSGAKLLVKTEPSGAEIYVGNEHKGQSDIEINLRTSRTPYRITARKEGFDAETISYDVRSREKVVNITLQPIVVSETYSLDSDPTGATVELDGEALGQTPLSFEVAFSRDNKSAPWKSRELSLILKDFQTERILLSKDDSLLPEVALERIRELVSLRFDTSPSGASVSVNGETLGKTPISETIIFERSVKTSPWPEKKITVSLENHQTESYVFRRSTRLPESLALSLLRHEKEYTAKSFTRDGRPLETELTIDGESVGKSMPGKPLKIKLEFRRESKTNDWPVFSLEAELPTKYYKSVKEISYATPSDIDIALDPILEIPVDLLDPTVKMMPEGVVYDVFPEKRLAMLAASERASQFIVNLKPVTKFKRADQNPDQRNRCLNSYTITPDGQSIIFCVTERRDEDAPYTSNMRIKQTADDTGGITRLTQSGRFLDTNPVIGLDGKNILVFQSNRSSRHKPDIYRVKLEENRFASGIARLTQDTSFNRSGFNSPKLASYLQF